MGNNTAENTGSTAFVHEWVAHHAAHDPQAPALVTGHGGRDDRTLTYGELDARASSLAGSLRRQGVGAESLVAVILPRSPEMVVAQLAILGAGAAYLSLDPSYPTDRLAFMLEDSGAELALVQSPEAEAEEGDHDPGYRDAAKRLDLELIEVPATTASAPETAAPVAEAGTLAAVIDPLQRAYVIYTSGSTGLPKGTELTHAGLMALVRWHIDTYRVAASDRATQVASPAFDASVWEIWPYLAAGAALHFPSEALRSSPAELYGWLADQVITLAFLPTPLAEAMLEEPLPEALALRALLVGGDKLRQPPPASLPFRLVNHYGPTEDTVVTTAGEVAPLAADETAELAPSIGREITGERVLLLSSDFERAADGEAGELVIGGSGLARGYLKRPAMTAERFVPDPFGGDSERLYRTGDLARRLPDGSLHFLGRIDHQVKVRGFRIEIGEVEAALNDHPSVRTAVVAARPDASGANRLVAYVVPDEGQDVEGESDLRDALAARLPEHMVPTAFVELAELPLTPNGKIDHDALPEPEDDSAAPWEAPRTATEERLCELFSRLLNRESISIHDHFFALGGHSLLAAQLVARVRQAFDVQLPTSDIFEHPTVAELATRLDRRADTPATLPPPPPVQRVPRDQPLPLAFPQRAVFFLDKLVPGSIAYNAQFTVSLNGKLDIEVLQRVLTEIVRRHEVLRTTFVEIDGQPVQQIHPPWEVDLKVVDLTDHPVAERQQRADELTREVVRRDFDLAVLPLAEWQLARLDDEAHLLIQVEHHFVHDGWSVGVLLRELIALYEAFLEGRPSPLPELPIQFADYATWQEQWMAGDVLAERIAFWRELVKDCPLVLDLPTDRPRPPRQRFRGKRLDTDLPAELYGELRALSRREGVTLFMTMLSAFQVLLYRYSGEQLFITGCGVANRTLREIETLIGMIVNTIVMRGDVRGEPTFRELLARVRPMTLGAQEHQDLPFDRLVDALAPPRDLSRNPVFQYMFSFHDSPLPDVEFAGLEGRLLERHNGSTKADFNVVFRPRAEQRVGRAASEEDQIMRVMWEYSTDLFDDTTIDRIWGHYQQLLRAAAHDPQTHIADLPLLGESERAQLLAWDDTAVELPAVAAVHELFEHHAEREPSALAAAGEHQELTYGELEQRANRLAHHLLELDVGPEVLVAVAMQPAPELLVAMLAVLKAGGAYLPLDPSHPRERIAYTLEDSRISVLLTDRISRDVVPEALAARVVTVDGELPETSSERPATRVGGSHLAYVIYTSGSTGRPKGTELNHRGLLNLISWHQRTYGIEPGDRAAKTASLAFDASVWEIWPYLTAGASLHFPSDTVRSSPARFYRWLAEEAIDITFLATPFAEAMLLETPPEPLALRTLLVGGDKLHRAPTQPLPFELVNHYGPTESTVVATCDRVAASAEDTTPPPIGRPIDNLRTRVMDRWLEPVPIGVPGELTVGGVGLARGYLGRPGLTAASFVPDPLASQPDERLYRTGDLVRLLPDRRIDFLGRIDRQIKLRGFRIELGEIESVIAEHPEIAQAAVALREAGAGEPMLAAYYVPSAAETNGLNLSSWLEDRLPRYMVPSSFQRLPALPLSPNGKVDRDALPEPELEAAAVEHVAPRTAVEEFLAEIWSEVLGNPKISALDNFFQLGGHSLQAGRILARVQEALGIELALQAVFENPTLEALAAQIESALLVDSEEPPPAGGTTDPAANLSEPQ
ncbi:MAG: amino acid adenylation domain-containing protein [Acidobacteriota bacterium]